MYVDIIEYSSSTMLDNYTHCVLEHLSYILYTLVVYTLGTIIIAGILAKYLNLAIWRSTTKPPN